MLKQIKQLLEPPIFQGNEDETVTAQVLYVLLTNILMLMVPAALATIFITVQKTRVGIILLILLILILISWALLRQGHIQYASKLFVAGLWTLLVAFYVLGGRTASASMNLLLATAVIAGILLGNRSAIILIGLNSLIGLGMAILESTGYPFVQYFPGPPIPSWATWTLALLLTIPPLNLTLQISAQGLRRARKSEARYRTLFEQSPDGIVILNPGTLQPVEFNDQACRQLGYTRDEFGKLTLKDIEAVDTVAESLAHFQKIVQEGRDDFETRQYTKQGKTMDVYVTAQLTEVEGHPAFHCIWRDITERKQAEKQIVQMKRLYATLSQINQMIVRVQDRDELYRSICDVAVQFGEFALAWVGLLDEASGDVQPVAAHGLDVQHWPFPKINIHAGALQSALTATALRTSKVMTSEDVQIDDRLKGMAGQLQKYGYHSSAAVPFRLRGKVIGVVSLASGQAGLFKAEEEVRLLEEMGLDISFALDTMATEAERKRAEQKIERQNQRLQVLREIDTAIIAADSVESILNAALSHIRQLIECRRAAVILFDWEKQEALFYNVQTEGETKNPIGTRLSLAASQWMIQIVSKNQPIVINELSTLPEPIPAVQQMIQAGFHSICILPLFVQNSLIGVLSMSSEIADFFDNEKMGLGREVANQVAIAIAQNRLLDSLRQLNAELERRVIERTHELSQTNIELEHANRAKDEFLATMSHELRTPLNSILGLSETLLEQRRDPLSVHQQRSLQTITASGQHLLELINDILDLSKIEARKFDHYPQLISVSELCRSSLAFVREQAVRKSLTLTYQEETAVSKVYADPRRLKQVLVNLLTNAVKFTPIQGEVTLQVYADPELDRIQFSVIDTGIGIALEDLRQLFVPFKQVDSGLTRDHEGSGLGLALVQKLTDLHGGSVDVESEVGKGSRFTINLPLRQASVAQQEANEPGGELLLNEQAGNSSTSAEEPLDHGIVLLADDNPANILMISDYLESHAYQVVVAHDGLDAIEKAEETPPDIILMDIQMPAMDGLEAMQRLRANPRFTSTPIIALTALAMPGDRERCLVAGANEYLSKPVSLKGLVKSINKLLGKEE